MSPAASPGACDACLRRSRLLARLAPRIAGLLGDRRGRTPALLALPDRALIERAAGDTAGEVEAWIRRFDASAERRLLAEAGVEAHCRHSALYPAQLAELADPPAALFGVGRRGVLEKLSTRTAVAVVGTRTPSPYGCEVAHALGRGLAAAGVAVVSGLALGIDASAHRGCLDAGGDPVAVLACGPDVAYPRRHRALHGRVAHEGIVLSEVPPGTVAYRWAFPARNRIMAGLAAVTVVVEATEPSGSLITAEFARDLGRTVAAVPGRVTSRLARGTNALLRDGAAPITCTEDLLDELFGAGTPRPEPSHPPTEDPGSAELRAVLEGVELERSVDEIGRLARLAPARVRSALGRLEADGRIVRRDLGGWERSAARLF